MDTLPIAARWPKHPYRGLDFYRETDALLFRERNEDVEECAAILLGFGVKILILQGSSGSGKSSFLRAGLIPHLKGGERRNFFLSGRDGVIRCTCDPLPEIARSLVDTLERSDPSIETAHRAGGWGAETLAEAAVGEEVRRKIERALPGPREQLAEVLVEGLVEVCGDLPGKLILVLDQAEEVLTLTPTGLSGNEAAAAFFRFLEDVYLRNVDMRLVVALRTEYYGRFRDELRISDDRLGKRPRSGGVEPYLLRPLREKSALLGIIDAPTVARSEDGTSVYDFAFEKGLAEQIVDDLLETFQYASVTPALQVVCSSLHERLTEKNRTITQAQYTKLGRINGITDDYLARGISAAGTRTKAQHDQWGELLHSLVSRQGGGTLVSLIRPLEELEKEAQDLGIQGDIAPALVKLTRGAAPLLRGEPPDAPGNFSLKHDVLAVVLARLHAAHEGAMKAEREARRRVLTVGLAAGLAALVIGVFLGSMLWQRAEDAFQAKSKIIDVRNEHASNAFEGNFRRSLLLTLANLDATSAPDDLYERITGRVEKKHEETLGELRKVLPRAPFFAGRYQAAGFDPASGLVALLRQGEAKLRVLKLRAGDGEEAEAYDLPAPALLNSMLRPAVGFVTGLGPVALVNDYVYFWNELGLRQECNLPPVLPPSFTSAPWVRTEFIAGRLQLSVTERQVPLTERQGPTSSLRVLRMDASDLRDCRNSTASKDPLRVPGRAGSQPMPAFSDAEDLPQRYDYLEETAEPAPSELAANLPSDPSRIESKKLVELDAVMGSADHRDSPMRIAVGQVAPERGIPERAHYTLAFTANAQATVFKFDGPDFYVYDLANHRSSNRLGYVEIPPQHIVVASDLPNEAWRLQPARIPWVYPPFAAAKLEHHWRAAWLAPNGVWAVESSDRDPGTAEPILHAPLIGEPDGAKLQFTRDGQFLVLQRVQFPSQVFLRVWDLRSSWQAWIEDPSTTEQELRAVACRIVRKEGGDGAFDEMTSKLFQIDAAHREPCPEPKGVGS